MRLSSPTLLITSTDKGGGVAIMQGGFVNMLAYGGSTGIAIAPQRLMIGLQPDSIALLEESGRPVNIHLGRHADIHDLRLKGNRCWAVATGRNEIVEFDIERFEMVKRWRFDGVGDAWHINCLGEFGGRLCFSAFGKFPKHRGYKTAPPGTGFVADLVTGKTLVEGLTHPHSIATEGATMWVCNSYLHEVWKISGGGKIASGKLGSYTRGLCVAGDALFVGVSALRNYPGTEGDHGYLLELDKETLEVRRKVELPFREVYEIAKINAEEEERVRRLVSQAPGYAQGFGRLRRYCKSRRVSL